jgi:hypothetical protein
LRFFIGASFAKVKMIAGKGGFGKVFEERAEFSAGQGFEGFGGFKVSQALVSTFK